MKMIDSQKKIISLSNIAAEAIYCTQLNELSIVEEIIQQDFIKFTSTAIICEVMILTTDKLDQSIFYEWSDAPTILFEYMKNRENYYNHLLNFFGKTYDKNEIDQMVCLGIGLWVMANILEKESTKSNNVISFKVGQSIKQNAIGIYQSCQ